MFFLQKVAKATKNKLLMVTMKLWIMEKMDK